MARLCYEQLLVTPLAGVPVAEFSEITVSPHPTPLEQRPCDGSMTQGFSEGNEIWLELVHRRTVVSCLENRYTCRFPDVDERALLA